jgi:hypothetical protein
VTVGEFIYSRQTSRIIYVTPHAARSCITAHSNLYKIIPVVIYSCWIISVWNNTIFFSFCLWSSGRCKYVHVSIYNLSYYSGVVISLEVERSEFKILVGARNFYLVQKEPKSTIGPCQISIRWIWGFPHRK